MAATLDLAAIFRRDAEALRLARDKAIQVHPSDIRAAGNEVEKAVREYLRRMLAPRYHVTSGHLIDSGSQISPQIDIIIADNLGLPSLLTTGDGTEYIPVESVFAIGEVKSTYYHSKDYYIAFVNMLKRIFNMNRPLVENTAYGGLQDHTTLPHMVLPHNVQFLNRMFSFFFCVDTGDFNFDKTKHILVREEPKYLPNISVFLNRGVLAYGKPTPSGGITFSNYPGKVLPQSTTGASLRATPTSLRISGDHTWRCCTRK